MSLEENKVLVRRYLEEVVNTGDVDRLAEFIAPDYIDRNDQGRGIEGAKRHVLGVRQTYPDLHVTVGQQVAEGEWVVTRVTGRGSHLGRGTGAVGAGVGVADVLAAGALRPGLPESTLAGQVGSPGLAP